MRCSANRSISIVETPGRTNERRSARMPRMMRFASSIRAISAGDLSVVRVTTVLDPSQARVQTGGHRIDFAEPVDLDQDPLRPVRLGDRERLVRVHLHPFPDDLLR